MIRRFLTSCLYVVTLRCERVDALRSTKPEAEWTKTERFAESLHVKMCKTCRRTREKLRVLDEGLRSFDDTPAEPLSDAARARMLDRLNDS